MRILDVNLSIIVLVAFFTSSCSKKISEREAFELNHLLWETVCDSNSIPRPIYQHPLDLSFYATSYLYHGLSKKNKRYEEKGLEFIAELEGYSNKLEYDDFDIYTYSFSYSKLDSGWYSAMANSGVSIAFQLAYDVTKQEKYRVLAERAMLGVVTPTNKGGCAVSVVEEGENYGPWFLEYADTSRRYYNSKLVLNGYLFTLANMKLYADAVKNELIQKKYDSSVVAFGKIRHKFIYADSSWTSYMLNPKTPEPAHYVIYDLILFDVLSKVDSEIGFVSKELSIRREILKNSYEIFKEEDSLSFIFSGKPHPHWIDIYNIKLEVFRNGEIERFTNYRSKNHAISFLNRVKFSIPAKGFDSIKVYSVSTSDVYLYTVKEAIKVTSDSIKFFTLKNSSYLQTKTHDNDKWYSVLSDSSYSEISFELDSGLQLKDIEYFGFFVEYLSDIRSMRLFLKSHNGKSISRYYLKPIQGLHTFVNLHKTGFYHCDNLNATDTINGVHVKVYGAEGQNVSLNLSDIYFMNNQWSCFKFLKARQKYFKMHEISSKGNIY